MRRIIILIAIVISALNCNNSNQNRQEDPGVLNQNFEIIDSLINLYIEGNKLPGGVALIAQNEEIIYNKSFGFKDKEKSIKQKKDDIFRLASMTKPVTSVAAMILYK